MAVDLGINGGICWSDKSGPHLRSLPSQEFDRAEIFSLIRDELVVAEDVRIFPGFSIKAGATFMIGKGFLIGACAVNKKTVEFIQPQEWIEAYTLKRTKHFKNKKKWKEHLLEIGFQIAEQRNDALVNDLSLKTCDAFLIWNYIMRRESGNPMKKISVNL